MALGAGAFVPFTPLIYLLAHLNASTMEVRTPDNPTEWQIGQTTFQSFDDAFIRISTFSHSVRGNLRVPCRNIRCFELACKEKECSFEAYIS